MTLELSSLTALAPIDGRYAPHTAALREYCSEFALIRYRVFVEIQWFLFLAGEPDITELPPLTDARLAAVHRIADDFSLEDAKAIKAMEARTNHDVKAVEYFIKEQMTAFGDEGLIAHLEFVHFACTSEDINNLSHALALKSALAALVLPLARNLSDRLAAMARDYAAIPMLSRTHGQAASPTTMGKELANVVARLRRQLGQMSGAGILGKFNGAVGNFNAHLAAYPHIDWLSISERFVTGLGLIWNPYTTQIEPHDQMAEIFQNLMRFNTILIDLDRDIWGYISIGYFRQKQLEHETGSSTMPHKVNPIDFENSEGNLGLANAILGHLAEKLPVSRWQRDLTDSTVLRNLGVGLAYGIIAYRSTLKGLAKLELNREGIAADLDDSWELLAEPIQTIMRKHGIAAPYEKLKAATRGKAISRSQIDAIIQSLGLPDHVGEAVRALSPSSYIGKAIELTERLLEEDSREPGTR